MMVGEPPAGVPEVGQDGVMLFTGVHGLSLWGWRRRPGGLCCLGREYGHFSGTAAVAGIGHSPRTGMTQDGHRRCLRGKGVSLGLEWLGIREYLCGLWGWTARNSGEGLQDFVSAAGEGVGRAGEAEDRGFGPVGTVPRRGPGLRLWTAEGRARPSAGCAGRRGQVLRRPRPISGGVPACCCGRGPSIL